jgi:integrase
MVHTAVHTGKIKSDLSEPISFDPAEPLSSDTAVKSAGPGEHTVTADAPGLILRVRASKKGVITRTWIVRVTDGGRRRRMGLGQYPSVTLGQARQKAADARRKLAEGIDPSVTAKRRERVAEVARMLTLAKAIDGSPSPKYKNPKSHEIRERALEKTFAPLHARDVTTITAIDIANILKPLAPQTAIKSHAAIKRVFDYAAAMLEPHGVPLINPADLRRLRQLGWSPKPKSESTLHAAVHWRVIPEVVAELSEMEDVVSACALLIVATGVRCETARLAKWANIDFEERTWTPPFADLKDGKHHKRPFIVPLNDVALDVLERMRVRSSSRFVFANSGGGPITAGDITNLIRRLRRRHPDWLDPDTQKPFTVHGFRSVMRTWTAEKRGDDSVLAELSLGHKVYGEVAGRYIRTGLVEERRALLDAYARHLRSESAKIITLRRG